MSFLSQPLLWFLLAASVPVIIHLLNKRRHKTIQWAAMQFLLKATRESRGKKKLRHILILTCRTLGIAALATAAARPLAGGLFGWGAGQLDTIILILDRSASMETTADGATSPKRSIALDRVRTAMKSLPSARLVLIDSATGEPQDIPSAETLTEIANTQATATTADVPSLLQRAADYILETSPGKTEIWIASDLAYSDWQKDSEHWHTARTTLANATLKTNIRIISLASPSKQNTTLKILSTSRSGDVLTLDLEINRLTDSTTAANLPLTIALNGTKTSETLTLTGQNLRFQKRLTLPAKSDSGHGWLSLPADSNPLDHTVHFSYGPPHPVKTLIVSTPNAEHTNYLALSAAPPGYSEQSHEIIPASAFPSKEKSLTNYASIIWAAPFPEQAASLKNYLEQGGTILFTAPLENTKTTFLDTTWTPINTAPEGKFLIINEWNHHDGLMRDTISGTPIAATTLKAIKRQIPQGKNLSTLATWDDGSAFLARHIIGKGTAYFLASVPDYTWSNLGDAHILLPAVQRCISQGATRFDSIYLANVGSPEATPKNNETISRLDDASTLTKTSLIHSPGTYRLGERIISTNLPLAEYDPLALTKTDLKEILEDTPYTTLEEKSTSAAASDTTHEIYRLFLYALLFFLIAEALLCLPNKLPTPATA